MINNIDNIINALTWLFSDNPDNVAIIKINNITDTGNQQIRWYVASDNHLLNTNCYYRPIDWGEQLPTQDTLLFYDPLSALVAAYASRGNIINR